MANFSSAIRDQQALQEARQESSPNLQLSPNLPRKPEFIRQSQSRAAAAPTSFEEATTPVFDRLKHQRDQDSAFANNAPYIGQFAEAILGSSVTVDKLAKNSATGVINFVLQVNPHDEAAE